MTAEIIVVAVFGLMLGSFFNAFVWRFGREESVFAKHSVCVHCKHPLAAADLIPLLSYLFLRGRCRYCHRAIPWHYPLVELATAVLLVLPLLRFGFTLQFAVVALLTLFLEALFLLDARYSVLPDAVTLPGIAVAILVAWLLGRAFEPAVIGGILGAGFFAAQYALSRGRWIGSGDIRLGGLMGIALGWQQLLVAFVIAYIVGGIAGILLVATRQKQWHSELPFGIFLTAATYAVLLWGDGLTTAATRVLTGALAV